MAQLGLVSIITPCYNCRSVIVQTIESVLSQTYKNWELLIIDDCSNDGSYEAIVEFLNQDTRIKYFKTDTRSGSPSCPRNIGIIKSQGDYIAFLDSDDIWLPTKLEDQLLFMVDNNYDFVYSDYEKISLDGNRNGRIIRVRKITTYWDLLESCSIPCLTVIVKKRIIDHVKFKNIPKEDYVFWLEILRKGIIAYNTGIVHALYRESKTSRSSNKLNMFKKQWYVLRRIEGIKLIPALYFIFTYAIQGIIKYIK